LVEKVYAAPGNAGTGSVVNAENIAIAATDIAGLIRFARENDVRLTVVGPEAPLVAGIVDAFEKAGLPVFGPSSSAARLEGSKVFMKEILTRAGVPTARYEVHTDATEAIAALARFGDRVVVKADGLAAGKGVVVASNREEAVAAIESMLTEKIFGDAGATIILEETLDGEEASILAFCDGARVVMMPASQDHKRIGDGDTGPNTGGMGAYSPAPVVTPAMTEWIRENIMQKTVDALAAVGVPYKGILYAGLMIGAAGPKTLEFNVRFGDPECQPIMMRMASDIVPVLLGCAAGDVRGVALSWNEGAAVCVVMAAGGYPAAYENGRPIAGLDEAGALDDVVVFHAGTAKDAAGRVVTAGGRVLGVTATAPTVAEAVDRAYAAVDRISWDGAVHRTDIGKKALGRGV
jgi:phosphoribosylamine--glycine ligase